MSILRITIGSQIYSCHPIHNGLMTFIRQDMAYAVMGQDCTPDESGFMKATGNGVILTDDIIKEIRYEMNRLTIHETAEKVLLGGESAQILLEEKEGSFRTIIEFRSSFSFGRRIHFVQKTTVCTCLMPSSRDCSRS